MQRKISAVQVPAHVHHHHHYYLRLEKESDPSVITQYISINITILTCCVAVHNLFWSDSSLISTPTAMGKQSEGKDWREKYKYMLGTNKKYLHEATRRNHTIPKCK